MVEYEINHMRNLFLSQKCKKLIQKMNATDVLQKLIRQGVEGNGS